MFIDKTINTAISMKHSNNKVRKLGVSYKKSSKACYRAAITNRCGGVSVIGSYSQEREAHKAWQLAKIDQLKELASTQTDARVINGLHRIAGKIQCEVDNGMETIKLDSLSIVENK